MARRRLAFNVVVTLVSSVATGIVFTSLAATTAEAAPGDPQVTVFGATPNDDGSATLAGLAQGPANTSIDAQVFATDRCGDSDTIGLPDLHLTTNAQGYAYFSYTFGQPGSPTGTWNGALPETLKLVWNGVANESNCYPVGPDNTSWENASSVPIPGGAGSASGAVALPGESRWYKFNAPPDSTISITLSHPSRDYSIAAYGDIGAADADLSDGKTSLDKLGAQAAGDAFSPSAFIPSAYSPSAFIPSAFIPSAFIPSAFIPSAFIPSAFIPSAFIPSAYSPSAFIPSAFIPSAFIPSAFIPSAYSPSAFIPSAFIGSGFVPSAFKPQTYSSAVNSSLLAYSDEGGIANKTITINTWQSSGPFYIRVAGTNGASSGGTPFDLSISGGSGSCSAAVVPIGSAPPAAPGSGRQTVILTDSGRVAGSGAAKADMMNRLQALAGRPEVNGVVVDLASSSRVQALDTQANANKDCPYAANLAANAIRDVVSSYRVNNPLKYVVVAGPDTAVPFFRHPDQTLLGNESDYAPPVADDSAAQAALRLGYTLSDNDYGAKVLLVSRSDQMPVPDLAVGRLVESASEISGMVNAYLENSGGVLPAPTSALVTGYDFLTFPAQSVDTDLAAGIGHANDTLIAPREQAPAESWTADQFRQKVLDSGRHDILFLAGHFSANNALAADYSTDMITTDLERSTVNLKNSLVFSAGCHSAYVINDGEVVPNVTLSLDWSQAFARKQAMLIGGTGFQYGDTDFIAYSEQIYADFAREFRYGTGPVSVGNALLSAKQTYLSNTPKLDAISQKAVYEATLYGLPMASINMPNGRIPRPSTASIVGSTVPVGTAPGSALGLRTADVTLTPNLTAHDKIVNDLTNGNAEVTTSYLSGSQGVYTAPYQPVLPVESRNVSVAGQSVRGALFLGGSYSDTSGITPLTGAPATEIRGVHTGFTSPTFFPEKAWNINYFDALNGANGGRTSLIVTPAQHVSDPGFGSTTNTRRAFSSMQFQLYYSSNTTTYGSGSTTSTPALAAPPTVVSVQTVRNEDTDTLEICAVIGGDPTAGVQRAVATYTDSSAASPSWASLGLAQGGCAVDGNWDGLVPTDSSSWGASLPLAGVNIDTLQFMVQAVSGTGLVTMDDNLGKYYGKPTSVGSPDPVYIEGVHLDSDSAAVGWTVTAFARVRQNFGGNEGVEGVPVTFTVGGATATGLTGSSGFAIVPITLQRPGTYALTVSARTPQGYSASADPIPNAITVTKQPTLTLLQATGGSLPTGATSYTAQVCATTDVVCNDYDAPVANRTVIFRLTGPITQTRAVTTNASGQARFDVYGLPPGSYSLTAYFNGEIPGVGTLADKYYADAAPTAVEFTTSGYADTDAPALTLPANITVNAPSGATGTVVSYVVNAHDAIDPRPGIVCTPPSSSFFAVGTTTVSCTTKDTAGNSANGSFTVTVNAPVATPVSVSVAGTQTYGSSSPTFTYTASPPSGVTLSGTLKCTKLSTGASISSALAVGTYRINPATCSGLAASNGATITYTAPANDFTVTKAATTLTVAPATHGFIVTTLSAKLTRTSNGAPIAGQKVTFSVFGQTICSGTTDATGRASCTALVIVLSLHPVNYTGTYAGNANYLGSSGSARL